MGRAVQASSEHHHDNVDDVPGADLLTLGVSAAMIADGCLVNNLGPPCRAREQLGLLAGVTRQTISSIETGQYNPSALLALVLARRLDKPVEDLFFLEDKKQ